MTRARFTACCVWLLGGAVAITGLYSGLDHWGRFFPRRLSQRAQMPLDVVVEGSLCNPTLPEASCARRTSVSWTRRMSQGASCICSRCVCIRPNGQDDDYTGDDPGERAGDSLTIWLCDDDDGQKQFGLSLSPGNARWLALLIEPSDTLPTDDSSPSALSLNSLHVRLQI